MSIKLTKIQHTMIEEAITKLSQAFDDISILWQELDEAYSAKSETWKESTKGEAYNDDLTTLEEWQHSLMSVIENVPVFDE
jgi:hypothetical protein